VSVTAPSDRLKREKKAVRRAIREARDALSDVERDRRTAAVTRHLFALPEMREAGTVMVFWSFGSEVGTAPILDRLHAEGRRSALPRVEGTDIVPVRYVAGDDMAEAAFGMHEPTGEHVLRPDEVDVIVTPGLAFDRRGYRIGYGGGFYDRFFARTRGDALKVGVCFAFQVLDEVPHGGHDRPVDAIVTDEGSLRCRTRG
jgi:5-formyltetrahydrofolate cyclo-ligase